MSYIDNKQRVLKTDLKRESASCYTMEELSTIPHSVFQSSSSYGISAGVYWGYKNLRIFCQHISTLFINKQGMYKYIHDFKLCHISITKVAKIAKLSILVPLSPKSTKTRFWPTHHAGGAGLQCSPNLLVSWRGTKIPLPLIYLAPQSCCQLCLFYLHFLEIRRWFSGLILPHYHDVILYTVRVCSYFYHFMMWCVRPSASPGSTIVSFLPLGAFSSLAASQLESYLETGCKTDIFLLELSVCIHRHMNVYCIVHKNSNS